MVLTLCRMFVVNFEAVTITTRNGQTPETFSAPVIPTCGREEEEESLIVRCVLVPLHEIHETHITKSFKGRGMLRWVGHVRPRYCVLWSVPILPAHV